MILGKSSFARESFSELTEVIYLAIELTEDLG